MSEVLVPAKQYTLDDLLNTVRALGPWWFCLTEDMKDPMGDQMLASLIATQQRALDTLATNCEVPAQLFKIDLSGERDLGLGTSMLRKQAADPRADLEHCVDESMRLLHAGGARMREIRAMRKAPDPSRNGSVAGLFVSNGGVPKLAVESVEIGARGLEGDRQATRRHHGRAWQALCLWSVEVVESLASEGHPILPGNAGENISFSGIDWKHVRPGTQFRIGQSVVAEVSLYALPCSSNSEWFIDGEFERMHHRRELGVSRLYASVLCGGRVKLGDTVEVQ